MIETGLNIRGFSYLSYSIDCVVSWVSGLISSGFNKHLQGADFFPRSWLLPFLSARITFSGHCKTAADNSRKVFGRDGQRPLRAALYGEESSTWTSEHCLNQKWVKAGI